MQVDLDVVGRGVVILGGLVGARRALCRFLAARATVTMVVDGSVPGPRSTFTTVGQRAADAHRRDVGSAVVVIGAVVSAAPRLAGSADLLAALSSPGALNSLGAGAGG